MIAGSVNEFREPIVTMEIHGPTGRSVRVQAIVDTGFNGFVSIPAALAERLSLPRTGATRAELANGEVVAVAVCRATVRWHGHDQRVDVLVSDGGPLIGMHLLAGSRLRIQCDAGGDVEIEPVQES